MEGNECIERRRAEYARDSNRNSVEKTCHLWLEYTYLGSSEDTHTHTYNEPSRPVLINNCCGFNIREQPFFRLELCCIKWSIH